MRRIAFASVALVLPLCLTAQAAPASAPTNPLTAVFRSRTMALQRNLEQAFNSIAEAKFGYRPRRRSSISRPTTVGSCVYQSVRPPRETISRSAPRDHRRSRAVSPSPWEVIGALTKPRILDLRSGEAASRGTGIGRRAIKPMSAPLEAFSLTALDAAWIGARAAIFGAATIQPVTF